VSAPDPTDHDDRSAYRPDPDRSAYRPDPDRDSAALVEMFLDRLGRELAALGVPAGARHEIGERIRERRAQLRPDDADLPDQPARHNRRYTVAMLAAYEVLSAVGPARPDASGVPGVPGVPGRPGVRGVPGVPTGPALLGLLRVAFVEPLATAVTDGTRAMLDAAADPFAAMVAVARAREHDDFGAEFVFEHPADDENRFFADVRRCGYHDFFVRHGAPELTPVLCAFDANWIRAIDPDRHGFTFTRETTIGYGAARCPFHFQRG
jgi:hypothetical protein